jgi:hypothetical protein
MVLDHVGSIYFVVPLRKRASRLLRGKVAKGDSEKVF